MTLFDRPDGKKIAKLDKGEWVKALGGETHSIPLRVVATREITEAGVHPGDTFYVLHSEGSFIGRSGTKAKRSTQNREIRVFQKPPGGHALNGRTAPSDGSLQAEERSAIRISVGE